jgi:hypothetical protein
MATTVLTSRSQSTAELVGLQVAPDAVTCVPDQVRPIHGPTSWLAAPVCVAFGHRWVPTPWGRWAFGWDREVTCRRCGSMRHERAKLHADLPYEDDR